LREANLRCSFIKADNANPPAKEVRLFKAGTFADSADLHSKSQTEAAVEDDPRNGGDKKLPRFNEIEREIRIIRIARGAAPSNSRLTL